MLRWIHRREKDTHPLKYDDVIRSRLRKTSDSFVSLAFNRDCRNIVYARLFFLALFTAAMIDAERSPFSFIRSAYPSHIPAAARGFSIRVLPSFLPSYFHHHHYSARSNRWSNPDFLLIAARGTRACKTLQPFGRTFRYPVERFLRRFHGNEKTQKAHRNYFAVVDRRRPARCQ